MDIDHVPSVKHQKRLNLLIQKVVKKEIIIWLDAGIVYPISNSTWVILVQCIPKKGSMKVVPNENNDLAPMCLITGWRVCMDHPNQTFG